MSRPITPSHDAYSAAPTPRDQSLPSRSALPHSKPNSYLGSGMPGTSAVGYDHPQGAPQEQSMLSQSAPYEDQVDRPASSGMAAAAPELDRRESYQSQPQTPAPSRGGTLKKKASLKRTGSGTGGGSLMRSASRRSSRPGSVRSVTLGDKEKYGQSEENHSVFYTPVPMSGSPTELLATRFQAWRKVLKDLITYFRDVQKSYESRAKATMSAGNVISSTQVLPQFLTSGGLGDAIYILRDFNKQSVTEGNKAKDIENEIILQLTGLRSDLQQKIKEIKSLSGDFKSSVGKEQEGTKRAVREFQEALGVVDNDATSSSSKGDPFIVKMGVDRQVARQIEEENYLHRAYLNLESSGRELESIVVGEIQKAYTAYAGILKREADEQYECSEKLRAGPLAMAKDHEWDSFVRHSDQMVDPRAPVRSVENVTYPGKDHPSAIEVRSGMLERKSKYLKNYTPGWYILSPTHLHEYKSADRIASQNPIMSLNLPEQKLGSHSEPMSSSHKFMLKGRQTGSMHRGHTWILRAESHDTMMAWFADIRELTETTSEQRNAFVRRTHARSMSGNSFKPASIGGSSDGGMEEDEADRVPMSTEQSMRGDSVPAGDRTAIAGGVGLGAAAAYEGDDARSEAGWRPPQRPSPGGRFPSEVNVDRGLQVPLSPSSGEGSDPDREALAAAGGLPGSGVPFAGHNQNAIDAQQTTPTRPSRSQQAAPASSAYPANQLQPTTYPNNQVQHPNIIGHSSGQPYLSNTDNEGEWLAPIAAGAGGAALGAGAVHHRNQQKETQHTADPVPQEMDAVGISPSADAVAAPIPIVNHAEETSVSAVSDDSPTVTHAGTASTHGDSISTVPTSVHADNSTTPNSYFDKNGTGTAQHTNADSSTGQVLTPPVGKVEALGIRPLVTTAQSTNTISDLHVPGEFPKTTM